MLRFLRFIGAYSLWFLAGGIFIGLLSPNLGPAVRPMIPVAIFLPLVAALIRLDWSPVRATFRRPAVVTAMVLWLLVASPCLAILVVNAVGIPAELAVGVVLMAAAPPMMSAAAVAMLLHLETSLVAVITALAVALTPVTLPVMVVILLGIELEIGVISFITRTVLFIGAAFLTAMALRRWLPRAWLNERAHFDGIAVLGMLIFAIAVMNGVRELILERPAYVATTALVAFLAHIGLLVAGALAFSRLRLRVSLSMGLMSSNSNLGLITAVLADRVTTEFLLFVALAQLPIYILPLVLAPLYRRLMQE